MGEFQCFTQGHSLQIFVTLGNQTKYISDEVGTPSREICPQKSGGVKKIKSQSSFTQTDAKTDQEESNTSLN